MAGLRRGTDVLTLIAGVIAVVQLAQAQTVDTSLLTSVEACQKVVTKHLLLTGSSIDSALGQLGETSRTIKSYLSKWGARVAAGQLQPGTADRVQNCTEEYLLQVSSVSAAMTTKLQSVVAVHVQWYDDKIFSLFTDVLSESGRDTVVKTVKDYLEPTLKTFESQLVASLKASITNLKPAYRAVSACIRQLSIDGD